MLTGQPYQISTSNQKVVIKLNRSLIEQDKLEQFLDYLTKAIQQKSQLAEEPDGETRRLTLDYAVLTEATN